MVIDIITEKDLKEIFFEGVPITHKKGIRWRTALYKDPCAYCGNRSIRKRTKKQKTKGINFSDMMTVDHIEPKVKGGKNGWENQTGACSECNTAKGASPLLLFLLEVRGCTNQF